LNLRSFLVVLIISVFINVVGYAASERTLEDGLYKQLRSTHFIIFYDSQVDKTYAAKIKDTAEEFYRIITQEFNLVRDEPWLWEDRTKIFIAKNKTDYLDYFSCSEWSGACVNYQERTIYTYPDYLRFKPIFIHELTHIIFRERVGMNNLPLWLDEGIAVYTENKYTQDSFGQDIQALKENILSGNYIKFVDLNKITTDSLASKPKDYVRLFYCESFSLVDLMISKYKKYNFNRFIVFLQKGFSVEDALNKCFYAFKGLDGLEKKWKKFYQD